MLVPITCLVEIGREVRVGPPAPPMSVSALVFLYQLGIGGLGVLGGGGDVDITLFFFKWGFIPEELTSGVEFTRIGQGFQTVSIDTPLPTWATIFTSMFIHGGLLHFAGNMTFLWVFGDNIENQLGHFKYLFFYLLTGVIATLSHFAVDPHSQAPLVGASGAIAGVMGAYVLTFPNNRIKAIVVFYLITVVEMRAVWLLGFWFGWQLFQSLRSVMIPDQVSVAFMAHVGGFVAGVLLMGGYKIVTGQQLWPRKTRPEQWEFWYRTRRPPE